MSVWISSFLISFETSLITTNRNGLKTVHLQFGSALFLGNNQPFRTQTCYAANCSLWYELHISTANKTDFERN